MADVRKRTMAVEEFLQWNLSKDPRYELNDGHPVPLRATAGVTREHDVIVVDLVAAIRNQLRGTACMPCTADTAVRTKIRGVRRPDVTIECGPLERGALEASNPVAVFEVLSPTTRKIDRSAKLEEYRGHPTIRTIVHVDPDVLDVIAYTKSEAGTWNDTRCEKPKDIIRIADTPVALKMSAIYEGVSFEQ